MEKNNSPSKDTATTRKRKPSRRVSPRVSKSPKLDFLNKIAAQFEDNTDQHEERLDDPDEIGDMDININCGVCGDKFDSFDALEKHISASHNKKASTPKNQFVAKEGGWKCNLCSLVLRTSRDLKKHKSKKECSALQDDGNNQTQTLRVELVQEELSEASSSSVAKSRSFTNAYWQQSDSRNWAAEFGCSKNSDDENDEDEIVKQPKSSQGNKKPVKPKDILSAMKLNFGANNEEDSTDENDEDEETYMRTKDGRSQRIYNREPRVLSISSRQTRKRLELLTKLAQEKMKEREKSRAAKQKSNNSSQHNQSNSNNATNTVNNNQVVDVSSGDEEGESDVISNKDNLLIPLANGWVCEKTRAESRDSYSTRYWSPDGHSFTSLVEIEKYAANNKLKINMDTFKAANIDIDGDGEDDDPRMSSVRVKDEETGLPMVIIFPGGRDCLTMDVSATA